MELIKIYNFKTNEILEKTFDSEEEADLFEIPLSFLDADYERYHNGERVY